MIPSKWWIYSNSGCIKLPSTAHTPWSMQFPRSGKYVHCFEDVTVWLYVTDDNRFKIITILTRDDG